MKKIFNLFTVLLVIVFVFVSCTKQEIYKNSISFPNSTWQRIEEGKEIIFEDINIKSIKDDYDINVSFVHRPTINVEEISFILKIVSPSGISKETPHTIKLRDRTNTKFIGNNLGEIIEIKEPVRQYATFSEKGKYTMIITNYSQKYEIKALKRIGLEIVKSNLDYEIQ